ncbi:MAG: hypothetical protein U0T73_04420 [Chitinophagales bacterium]
MKPIQIFIAENIPQKKVIWYTLQLIAINKRVEVIATESLQCDLQIDQEFPLCLPFYQLLDKMDFSAIRKLAGEDICFYDAKGRPDELASIFYLSNCLQEYNYPDHDHYGRFPLEASYQFKSATLRTNIVQQLIDQFCTKYPAFSYLKDHVRKSTVFLSHDIDFLYKAKNEDGAYALKSGKWLSIPKLLWNHYAGTPDWMNMEDILKLENSRGFHSTFFWLVQKDQLNADYEILDPNVNKLLRSVEAKRGYNGLHKSIGNKKFKEELQKFPLSCIGNRYHFLKCTIPSAWKDVQESGLHLDSSLGFASDYGFRNSYGLPFAPFDLEQQKPFSFIEVPLMLMDRTLFNSRKPLKIIKNEIFDWLDKNLENCVFAINFHNNFFSELTYAGYRQFYTEMLEYFRHHQIQSADPNALIAEFGFTKGF